MVLTNFENINSEVKLKTRNTNILSLIGPIGKKFCFKALLFSHFVVSVVWSSSTALVRF